MTDDAGQHDAGKRSPMIFVERPRCPVCDGVRLLTYRSTTSNDGSVTRYAKCADCGQKVRIILE